MVQLQKHGGCIFTLPRNRMMFKFLSNSLSCHGQFVHKQEVGNYDNTHFWHKSYNISTITCILKQSFCSLAEVILPHDCVKFQAKWPSLELFFRDCQWAAWMSCYISHAETHAWFPIFLLSVTCCFLFPKPLKKLRSEGPVVIFFWLSR